ncbi:DUF455 family protein [Paenibacillus psychroresistens]|nr:DUF455 family protein [Paenibacillus psychroresistens]
MSLTILQDMSAPGNQNVENSSLKLKRLYYLEREMMRFMGGFLPEVATWSLKLLLPRHMWEDSLRAGQLRTRILEMRYPRKDVDKDHSPALQKLIQAISRCSNEREFIEGIYFAAKRNLCLAYEEYTAAIDPLDDAPTLEFIARFAPQIRDQILDMEQYYVQTYGELSQATNWQGIIQAYIDEIGGVFGSFESDNPIMEVLLNKPAYVIPEIPKRDPAFEQGVYMVYPQIPEKFVEKQVWFATIHANEMWAAEIAAQVLWEWDDMPWDFYMDCARWSYDETRHTAMGIRRLTSWGFTPGIDFPMVPEPFKALQGKSSLDKLALLHALELSAVGSKLDWIHIFETGGDSSTSQDIDFDWADESIHLLYGHKWVLHRLGGDLDLLEELKENALSYYEAWKSKVYPTWDYEPFKSRLSNRIQEIEKIQGVK